MIPDAPRNQPPILSAWDMHVPFEPDDPRPAVRAWLDHVAAGRIGAAPADDSRHHARRLRTEALLARHSRPRIW
jgi:hypothetical protein